LVATTAGALVAAGAAGLVGAAVGEGAAQAANKAVVMMATIATKLIVRIFSPSPS
jgi:hypothetical protein